MIFPSEQDFALLLFQLFALLSLGLALGELFRRLRQPTVIGEILTGVLLGPSVLGVLAPGVSTALFPGPQTQLLGSLAWLGSVFLLLVAGLEINLAILIQQRRVVALSSLVGIAVPFTFGCLLGFNLPDDYLINPAQRLLFSLFLATALSISAIPVIAKILLDLGLLRTSVGQAILGAAIVNDLVGWVFFAVILSMLNTNVHGQASVTATVILTTTFAIGCLTLGRKLVTKLFGFFKNLKLPPGRDSWRSRACSFSLRCLYPVDWYSRHLRRIFGRSYDRRNR